MLATYLELKYSPTQESRIPDLLGSLVYGVLKSGLLASCFSGLVAARYELDPRSQSVDSNYPGSRMSLVG